MATASTSSFNGNVAPTRTIASGVLVWPLGISLDASDNLYVADIGGNNVQVFANASTLNGTVAPTRTLNSGSFGGGLQHLFVDSSNDRLFVVDQAANQVFVFNNASTLNGTFAPNFTLTVIGAGNLVGIAVDSSDNGYITDRVTNSVYSYNNISTLNGPQAPDRTIVGTNTQLSIPEGVFLQP